MDRQDDLAGCVIHIGDDVGDQRRNSRWRVRMVTAGAFHAASRSSAKPVKSGGTTETAPPPAGLAGLDAAQCRLPALLKLSGDQTIVRRRAVVRLSHPRCDQNPARKYL